jgi:hypothetical protein
MRYPVHLNSTLIVALSLVLFGCAQQTPSSKALAASPTPAEPPPPARPGGSEKIVGKAKAYYSPKIDETEATVDLDLIGQYESASKADNLEMLASFAVPGKKLIRPESMHFVFTSRSRQLKYQVNHKFTIFLDGAQFASAETKVVNSGCKSSGSCEEMIRSPELPYDNFLRLLEAKEVEMQLGETRFKLKGEAIEALRDLSRIAEQ